MKALLSGMGMAAVAGVLMGFAMRPDLMADDRPEGPQIFTTPSEASTGPFDTGTAYASYPGKVPDYVIGTDAAKANTAWTFGWANPQDARDARRETARNDTAPPEARDYTPAGYDAPPPEPAAYQSTAGDSVDANDVVPLAPEPQIAPDPTLAPRL